MTRSFFKPERPRFAEARRAIGDAIREAETSPDRYGIHGTDLLWKNRWLDPNIAYVAWEICASRSIIPMDWFVSRVQAQSFEAPRQFGSRSAAWGNVRTWRTVYPYTPIEVLTFASDTEGVALCEEMAREARRRMGWKHEQPTWISLTVALDQSTHFAGTFPNPVRSVIAARYWQPSSREGSFVRGSQESMFGGLQNYQDLWNVSEPNPFDPLVKIYELGYGIHMLSENTTTLVAPKATKSGRTRT